MQALLNDIELDVQELKCLIQSMLTDTNPVLRIVAKRNIHQMQERLDALTKLLDDTFVITPAEHVASDIVEKTTESEVISESVADVPVEATHVSDIAVPASQILAERIKPATDLQHAISLNDSFRFTRELFAGDATTKMDKNYADKLTAIAVGLPLWMRLCLCLCQLYNRMRKMRRLLIL